jgi:hypothetical protein
MNPDDLAAFRSLEGGSVLAVGTCEASEEWMGRVPWLEIRRKDGSTVVVECWCDEEGNGPGALWFNEAPVFEDARPGLRSPVDDENDRPDEVEGVERGQ